MKNKTLLYFCFILIISCSKTRQNDSFEEPVTTTTSEIIETPKILENDNSFEIISSFKRGYEYDILENLYQEAIENNKSLKKLEKEIERVSEMNNDTLGEFYKYLSTNSKYWESAYSLIDSINDSILKTELKDKILKLDSNFNKSLSQLLDEKKSIEENEKQFQDKYKMLKLFVTLRMIKNYQKNEKPKLQTLSNLKKTQLKLLEQIEQNIPR